MLTKIRNLISYILPVVVTKTTAYNGDMRVILSRGRKKLDSKNANYSYGSLHRIMRFALAQVTLPQNERILLLGLGGGSVIQLLRDELRLTHKIIAVDIDPAIIAIAREDFNLNIYADTEIICDDAYEFVRRGSHKYGLVIIDLFINNKVPEKFYDTIFWDQVSQMLMPGGSIIFNTMIQTTDQELFASIVSRLRSGGFSVSEHNKVDTTNLIIIAKAKTT